MIEAITPDGFLELSADIAYRLSGQAVNPRTLLDLVLDGRIAPCPENILIQALQVILTGYGDKHRKMGPLAVIHPIRAAVILSRVSGNPSMLDLLTTFLHDRDEDLTEEEIGADRWQAMCEAIENLNRLLDEGSAAALAARLRLLTIQPGQTYNDYLVTIMAHSQEMPDLIRAKMADRTDNTLDIGVSRHGIKGQGAFGTIFDLMFLPNYPGLVAPPSYVPLTESESVQILANLFKNIEFVSLLRTEGCHVDSTSEKLRDGLLNSSIRIARFLVQDALVSLPKGEQKDAIDDVWSYCLHGGLAAVYVPRKEGVTQRFPLDGLFAEHYGSKDGRKARLKALVADKRYLARAGIALLAAFSSFRSDPNYRIQGIDRRGITPQSR